MLNDTLQLATTESMGTIANENMTYLSEAVNVSL